MRKKQGIFIYTFIIASFLILISISCKKDDVKEIIDPNVVTDIDGNAYKTVKIGDQVWMAENLKTTKYRNGDPIPNISYDQEWSGITTGACCSYLNYETNLDTYGKLYNWFAVNDSRNLAPVGWHIPSKEEMDILINYLGGESIAPRKLLETGTQHWSSQDNESTNESGFTALPSGTRNLFGVYNGINQFCYLWSSSIDTYPLALVLKVDHLHYVGIGDLQNGCSIRCIKD